MAKIPRIEQGDRPSGLAPAPGINTEAASAVGVLGGISEAAMGVATNSYLREQKRLAEAMDAKQKIVDASDTGRLTTQFERNVFDLEDQLHGEFAENPTAAVDEYMKRSRELSPKVAEMGQNDYVKLAVTQGNESTISSGLTRMHGWVSTQQTKRIKGNVAQDINEAANGAAKLGSAETVEAYAGRVVERLSPIIQATFSPAEATKETEKLVSAIAKRYGDSAAKDHPLQFSQELESSSFLKKNLSPDDHAALTTAADKGYMGLKDRGEMDLAKEAFSSGERLAGLVGAPEFVSAAAAKEAALTERKKIIAVDPNLKPADRKTQIAQIDQQLKRIDALKSIAYKQADIGAVDDPKELQTLWVHQNGLFGKKAKKSAKENLSLLVDQQTRLIQARDAKTISHGNFKTMFDDVSYAYKKALAQEEGNTTHWISYFNDPREVGNTEINKRFDSSSFKNISEDQKTAVRIAYIKRLNSAQSSGEVTEAQAKKFALEALSLETGIEIPGVFK